MLNQDVLMIIATPVVIIAITLLVIDFVDKGE